MIRSTNTDPNCMLRCEPRPLSAGPFSPAKYINLVCFFVVVFQLASKTTGAMAAHRKLCVSRDASEASGSEKPGTSVCLSLVQAGRSNQEYQLDAGQRYACWFPAKILIGSSH